MMKSYVTVEADNKEAFDRAVNALLKEGYELRGPSWSRLDGDHFRYRRAMVKVHEAKTLS